jgi:hypothetical protein
LKPTFRGFNFNAAQTKSATDTMPFVTGKQVCVRDTELVGFGIHVGETTKA